jgi:hypothetical protein
MELSKVEILKLNEILKFLNNERFKEYDILYLKSHFKIDREEYMFLYNHICNFSTIEHNIGNVTDLGKDYQKIWCDYNTDRFIKNGGFEKYYKVKKTKELESIKPNITAKNYIGGDNYGFQSLDTDLINPAIQKANKIIPHNPPKRSFLEIASWVFGIIVAVIVIYEFIIKD